MELRDLRDEMREEMREEYEEKLAEKDAIIADKESAFQKVLSENDELIASLKAQLAQAKAMQ